MNIQEYISNIKWSKGFCCRKCNYNKFYEYKDDYTRKCLKCDKKESIKVGTAFERMRIDLGLALEILTTIASRYEQAYNEPRTVNKEFPARFSTNTIASEFNISQKAASRFINHILKWLPDKKRKQKDDNDDWFYNIKPEKYNKYNSLYHILIDKHQARNLHEIIKGLVLKKSS